jgi:hypothetical protein
MSARQSRTHSRPPAATGTTASIARISGSAGISDQKAGSCARKHGDTARTPARENPPEMMTRTMPAQTEPAQKPAAEATPAEQPTADFVWPTFGPPKTSDLDAQQPTTTINNHRQDQAPTDAQEETVWPVLTRSRAWRAVGYAIHSLVGISHRCSGAAVCRRDFQARAPACSIVSRRPLADGPTAPEAAEEVLREPYGGAPKSRRSQIRGGNATGRHAVAADIDRSG